MTDAKLTDANPLPEALPEELRRRLEFVIEVDQMKAVLRDTVIPSAVRRENDAEHSWHLTLMALVLAGHAREAVDVPRVLTMLIVHDLVEVYAGDTPLHLKDDEQAVRETAAADRLFPLLPGDEGARLRAAWEEFEAHETAEAQFARSLDRIQPLLMEWMHAGRRWQHRAVSADGVRSRLAIIADGSPDLWGAAEAFIDAAETRGYLQSGPDDPGAAATLAAGAPATALQPVTLDPIGAVVGGRPDVRDDDWDAEQAVIRLDASVYGPDALAGLDAFSHLEVIYLFDRVDPARVERGARHPRGNQEWPKVGIFAQRAKDRPNRIGVTRCRILAVDGLDITVAGLDAVDGTPVLDLKPHMPGFDARGDVHQPAWADELMRGYW